MSPEQFAALPEADRAFHLAAAADTTEGEALLFLRGQVRRGSGYVCPSRAASRIARRAVIRARLAAALERIERPRLVVHVGQAASVRTCALERGHGPYGCVLLLGAERVPFIFHRLIEQFGPLKGATT